MSGRGAAAGAGGVTPRKGTPWVRSRKQSCLVELRDAGVPLSLIRSISAESYGRSGVVYSWEGLASQGAIRRVNGNFFWDGPPPCDPIELIRGTNETDDGARLVLLARFVAVCSALAEVEDTGTDEELELRAEFERLGRDVDSREMHRYHGSRGGRPKKPRDPAILAEMRRVAREHPHWNVTGVRQKVSEDMGYSFSKVERNTRGVALSTLRAGRTDDLTS